ncbi:MAG: hypothetical protein Q8P89_02555 [bacterium]|nr:hypothetical protein [bacterium]
MKKILTVLCLLLLSLAEFSFSTQIFSQTPTPDQQSNSTNISKQLNDLQDRIKDYEQKLLDTRQQKKTLSSQIIYMDNQVALTNLRIEETQTRIIQTGQEITSLSAKIAKLETSLDNLSAVLINRIVETYKRGGVESWQLLISSQAFSDLLNRTKYIRIVQAHDKRLMYQMEETKLNYQEQKKLLEEKKQEDENLKKQLDGYKVTLARQKAEKVQFLEITKNDEKRYQELLAKARAEQEAIQSIIAGAGNESEVGLVNEGQKIANIIPAPSACSNGAHLHLEVVKDGAHQNPADFLANKQVAWDNSPDSSFGFGGSWPWPINDPVRITQGYGMTYYASTLRYYGGSPHTGLDMVNENDWTVKAIRQGTLYRGAIACGRGTLRYVRVKQNDSYDTYYLHVSY